MREFKAGDRVKVEFEGTVTSAKNEGRPIRVAPDSPAYEFAWVNPERLTLIAPKLPTKPGTVIESRGFRFMLTAGGWHADGDQAPWPPDEEFEESMYAKDFTVLLEGKGL